jgi:hypothetical protein
MAAPRLGGSLAPLVGGGALGLDAAEEGDDAQELVGTAVRKKTSGVFFADSSVTARPAWVTLGAARRAC